MEHLKPSEVKEAARLLISKLQHSPELLNRLKRLRGVINTLKSQMTNALNVTSVLRGTSTSLLARNTMKGAW